MTNAIKSRIWKQVRTDINRVYETFHDSTQCYYCGELANELDHVPPISVIHNKGIDWINENGIRLFRVMSCRECNSLLGSKNLYTLDDRVLYLYRKLPIRYEHILKIPEWTEEEISELGRNMRSEIEQDQQARSKIERRLQYMEEIFYDVLVYQD